MCGAVLRGLEGSIITERKCRRHYGFEIAQYYDPVRDKGYDSMKRTIFVSAVTGDKYLTGGVTWLIGKVSN